MKHKPTRPDGKQQRVSIVAVLLVLLAVVVLGFLAGQRGEDKTSPATVPKPLVVDGESPQPEGRNEPPLGQLRDAGKQVLVSTAGLRYGPGSREGHRLKHVEQHLRDEPTRRGSHGVFLGGRAQALAVIDEAYQIAQQRGPPTQVQQQGPRTVYTIDMGRKIGFVGGQTGRRLGNPAARHVRIVLENQDVVTAYPLIP